MKPGEKKKGGKPRGQAPPRPTKRERDGWAYPEVPVWRVGIAFGVLALARVVTSFFPAERLWGLHHTAFLPAWTTWTLAAAALAFCTPVLLPAFRSAGGLLFGKEGGNAPSFRPWVLAVGAACLFWALRLETYFLGDGAVYLSEIYRFVRGIPGSEDVLYSKGSAPGTGWVHAQVARAAFRTAPSASSLLAHPQFAFWVVGACAGACFVFLAWHAARSLFERGGERLACFTLCTAAPGVLFFFGYVEYYTLFYTAFAAYLFFGMRAASKDAGILPAVAAFAASLMSHFMAVVALPSLVFLLVSRSRNTRIAALARPRPVLFALAAALAVGGVYYFASGIHIHGSRTVLSLYPFGREGAMQWYTLLSSWHLVDFLNDILLLGGPVLLGAAFVARREAFDRPDVLFVSVNTVFFVYLVFFGNMGFGMARDWDISAGLGIAFVFWFLALSRACREPQRREYILYAAAGSFLTAALAWLMVNLTPSAAVERAKVILAYDDRHVAGDYALNGYEHLRKYFDAHGDAEGVTWAIRKKIECVGYPEDFRKLALRTIREIPAERKRAEYEWLFDRLAEKIASMNAAGKDSVYAGSKAEFLETAAECILQCRSLPARWGFDDGMIEEQYRRFAALAPGSPVMGLLRAQLDLFRSGSAPDREAFLRGASAVRSSPTLAAYAGITLLDLGEYAAAREALRRAVRLDTAFTLPLLYLAEAEWKLGPENVAEAEMHVDRFLRTPEGWRVFGPVEQREALRRRALALKEALQRERRVWAPPLQP
ncbi:MAG: hypothetical protein QHI48_04955 [Bacteroidota bacterium]|nr:hypothetical protein [Bacteroidota bacterium]